MSIENHPAWKLIPDYTYDYGVAGKSNRYVYLVNPSGEWHYCIDYIEKEDIRIEKWVTGRWTPVYREFESVQEALQVLATLIATDAIQP